MEWVLSEVVPDMILRRRYLRRCSVSLQTHLRTVVVVVDWAAAKYAAKKAFVPNFSEYRETWSDRDTLKDVMNRQTPGGVIGTHLSFITYDLIIIGMGIFTDTLLLSALGGSLLVMTAVSMFNEFRNTSMTEGEQ